MSNQNVHLAFIGPPASGKTTFAKRLAEGYQPKVPGFQVLQPVSIKPKLVQPTVDVFTGEVVCVQPRTVIFHLDTELRDRWNDQDEVFHGVLFHETIRELLQKSQYSVVLFMPRQVHLIDNLQRRIERAKQEGASEASIERAHKFLQLYACKKRVKQHYKDMQEAFPNHCRVEQLW